MIDTTIDADIKCTSSYKDGSCCCNCKHQLKYISMGNDKYMCTVPLASNHILIDEHGICELYIPLYI